MSTSTVDPEALRRYLLGEAADDLAEELERAYLAHPEALEAVAAAEDDLIDDYLAGRLAPEARARFDSHYLASPAHAQRLAITRGLRARAEPRRSWMRFVPLAAAVLVVALAAGLRWMPSGGPVSITLSPLALRGEGVTPTLALGTATEPVELRLELGGAEPLPRYQVLVRTVEGKELWRGPAAAGGDPSKPLAVASLPAGALAGGDDVVVLGAVGPDGRELQRYYLRVIVGRPRVVSR